MYPHDNRDRLVLPVSGINAQSLFRCPTPAVQTHPPTYRWSLYSSTIMYITVQLLLLDIFIFRVLKRLLQAVCFVFFPFIMLIWPLWHVSDQKADSLSASTVFTGALLSSPLQQSYGLKVSASRTQTHTPQIGGLVAQPELLPRKKLISSKTQPSELETQSVAS